MTKTFNEEMIKEDAIELLERLSTAVIIADQQGEMMQDLGDDLDCERLRGKIMIGVIAVLGVSAILLADRAFPVESAAVRSTAKTTFVRAKDFVLKVVKR